MVSFVKRFLLVVLLSTLTFANVTPRDSIAQTTGLGWDNYTRQLWRASDQHIALWLLDPNLNYVDGLLYGPYAGWYPVAITTGNNNYSYVLWRTATGNAAIWLVDPNLNFVSLVISASEPGWNPDGISIGTSITNVRLTWRSIYGELAIWSFDENLNYLGGNTAGPFYGYDPGPAPEALPGKAIAAQQLPRHRNNSGEIPASMLTLIAVKAKLHGAAIKRAAAAMAHFEPTEKIPALRHD